MTPIAARLRTWFGGRPLRVRLVAAVALAVALAVVGVVTVALVVVRHELLGHVDGQLRQQASELRAQAEFSSGRGLPVLRLRPSFGEPGGYVQALAADGSFGHADDQAVGLPITSAARAVAGGTRSEAFEDISINGTPARMLTSPLLPGLAVQVALPIGALNDQLARLTAAFTLLGGTALGLAVLLAWLVSRTALAPVGRLTDTAERVASTRDLSVRIDDTGRDELGRLAASFNSMLDALQRSQHAQRQLVQDASHELRTPLTSLRTNVEVLREIERLPAAEREELIAGVVGQLDELTGLVADVVELARGDEPVLHRSEVDFDEVVAHAVGRARRYWPGVRFEVQAASVVVSAVPARLDRAVTNLLDNAAKFSGGAGDVEVRLAPDGALVVRDHGPGIPDAALPHIFDRFFRADEVRGMPGSGLGLAIVAQVATSHGGAVAARNHPDGGAEVAFRLPVVRLRPAAPGPGPREAVAAPAAGPG